MTKPAKQPPCVLSLAPVTRGVGFAVLEGETLVNWGVKTMTGIAKNAQLIRRVEELIRHYQPDIVTTEATDAKHSRRAPRIRALTRQIAKVCAAHEVKLKLYSQERIRRAFFAGGIGTKHELAALIANRFPQELGPLLPPKRKLWDSENYRMAFFEAVALVLMPALPKRKSASSVGS